MTHHYNTIRDQHWKSKKLYFHIENSPNGKKFKSNLYLIAEFNISSKQSKNADRKLVIQRLYIHHK